MVSETSQRTQSRDSILLSTPHHMLSFTPRHVMSLRILMCVNVCRCVYMQHGFHGPNWVGMLQSQYPSMVFINCGVNGEVLER